MKNQSYDLFHPLQIDADTKYKREVASPALRNVFNAETSTTKIKHFSINLPKQEAHTNHAVGKVIFVSVSLITL